MSDNAILEGDPEPSMVKAETVWFSVLVIAVALGLSITTNTYHDLHGTPIVPVHGTSIPPWGMLLAFGISIPALVAVVSHTAATLNVHWGFRALVAAPAGAFMAYSANAGITTLAPSMGTFWAALISITIDTTAMVYLGVLMYAAEMKKRHDAWERQAGQRRRQAQAEAEQRRQRAEVEVLAARQSRGSAFGNGLGSGGDNAPDSGAGNASGGAADSTRALPAAGAGRPALPPAATPAAPGDAGTGEGAGERNGDDPTSVTPFRRPAASDDEMRLLAEDLADKLEAEGRRLSIRIYMNGDGGSIEGYGGSPNRVTKIVNEVNAPERVASRAAQRDAQRLAAVGE